jgi:hypothetical protein
MPELVRLYIRHVLIGVALGVAFTGLLLWLNVGNLWHLVRATEGGVVAVLMLAVFNSIVFAGVQFAIAVMGMDCKPKGGDRGRRVPAPESLRPAPAVSRSRSVRRGR